MKTSCVLITAAMLGSSSFVYAESLLETFQAGLQEERVVPPENASLPEGAEGIQNVWECNTDDPNGPTVVENKYGLPSNIKIDNSNPLYNYRFCRITPMKMDDKRVESDRFMADFKVEAGFVCGDDPTEVTSTATFNDTFPAVHSPDHPYGGGSAEVASSLTGPNWTLVQHGSETWDNPWTIHIEPVCDNEGNVWKMKWIEIDLLSKTELDKPKGVFDVCLADEVTEGNPAGDDNGSGVGWPVQPNRPYSKLVTTGYTATYSKPVLPRNAIPLIPIGDPVPAPHDLYGKVRIDFNEGVTGTANAFHQVTDLASGFWMDTDCLPIDEIDMGDPDENNEVEVTITGEGNVFFKQYPQSNPSQVEEIGHVSVELTDPVKKFNYTITPGSCYEATAVDDSGAETGLTKTKCYD